MVGSWPGLGHAPAKESIPPDQSLYFLQITPPGRSRTGIFPVGKERWIQRHPAGRRPKSNLLFSRGQPDMSAVVGTDAPKDIALERRGGPIPG